MHTKGVNAIMYKKYKKIIDLLVVFGLSTFVFTIISLCANVPNHDNIWNFHYIQKIADGNIPYRDFNIIIPPLFHYIGLLFYKIFGDNLFIMDIYGGVINATLFILCNSYINSVFEKRSSRITGAIIVLTIILVLTIGANYNILMLIPIISVMLLEKKYSSNSQKFLRIAEGILMASVILIKQNVGLFFNIAFYIYLLLTSKKGNYLKTILPVLLSEIIIGTIFSAFLIIKGNFFDMFNYCIGGISEFRGENFIFSSEVLAILFIIIVTSIPNISNYKKYGENYHILQFLFTISSFFIAYPIMNTYHVWVGLFVPILSCAVSLSIFFKDCVPEKRNHISLKIGRAIIFLPFLFIVVIRVFPIITYQYYDISDTYKVYKYCGFTNKDFEDYLKKIDDFYYKQKEKGYEVYIISSDAPIYGIIHHISNGDLDLLLYGNMGKNGVNKNIERLSQINNPCFLKTEWKKICFQEPKEIEDYVVNNYKYIKDIENFRVFTK